jgi:hypothetical protein
MASRRKAQQPNDRQASLAPPGRDAALKSQRRDISSLTPAEVLARERLLDLAYDVSSRLRHHVQPAVRVSAALLIAASLAACQGDATDGIDPVDQVPSVQPLQQEVAQGLPTQAGRYPIVERSLQRDEQGVYHFGWREPGQTEGPGTSASASRVRLNQGSTEMLEIPTEGDPILHLRQNSEILLASAAGGIAAQGTPTSGSGGRTGGGSTFMYWRPLYTYGGGGPAYYDPPRSVPSGAPVVDAATRSTSPAPAASRTFGVVHSVAGRAGGTGGGFAASARAGADTGSGGKSGVSSPGSSGFSGGAATAKGGGGSS